MKPTKPWHFAALAAIILGLLIIMLMLVSSPPQAASFNCNSSRSATEATICSSQYLSLLDLRLAKAYRGSDISTWSQRIWLRQRDRCGVNEKCIMRAYRDRLHRLER